VLTKDVTEEVSGLVTDLKISVLTHTMENKSPLFLQLLLPNIMNALKQWRKSVRDGF
jgi:hypothetical protein